MKILRLSLIIFILFLVDCTSSRNDWNHGSKQFGSEDIDLGNSLPIELNDSIAIDTTQAPAPPCPPSFDYGIPQCEPIPTYKVMPKYLDRELPHKAATIWVQAYVDSSGRVTKASILKSDDISSNKVVLRAMMQWKFKTCESNGKRVGACVSVPFRQTAQIN